MTDEEKQKALKDALALAENESDYHHRRCREARRDLEWHTREMERCDVTVKALKELVSAPITTGELPPPAENKGLTNGNRLTTT